MLIEKLRAAVEHAAELPPTEQEQLAAAIDTWLAEKQWDDALEDSHGDAFVAELMQEAHDGSLYPWPTSTYLR